MKIIIFVLLFLITSCSGIGINSSLIKLEYGMSKNEVINDVFKLKPTEKKIVDKDHEIYVYYIHSSLFDFFFNRERFPYVGFYPINRTGKEYWLMFNSKIGLVKSSYANEWGRVK